jgi:hypothetical protein
MSSNKYNVAETANSYVVTETLTGLDMAEFSEKNTAYKMAFRLSRGNVAFEGESPTFFKNFSRKGLTLIAEPAII